MILQEGEERYIELRKWVFPNQTVAKSPFAAPPNPPFPNKQKKIR